MPVSILKKELDASVASLPSPDEIRDRISENLQERDLLRRMLKIAQLRQQAAEFEQRKRNRRSLEPASK